MRQYKTQQPRLKYEKVRKFLEGTLGFIPNTSRSAVRFIVSMNIDTNKGIRHIEEIQYSAKQRGCSAEMTAFHLASVLTDSEQLGVSFRSMFKYILGGAVSSVEFDASLGYLRVLLTSTEQYGTVGYILNDRNAIKLFQDEMTSRINTHYPEVATELNQNIRDFVELATHIQEALLDNSRINTP